MENFFLSALVGEIQPQVTGRALTKISQVGSVVLLDFRLPDGWILKISLDPTSPALYVSRSVENASGPKRQTNTAFILQLKKEIGGARLLSVSKDPLDRLVRFEFERFDAGGEKIRWLLVVSLTGRTSNVYLADRQGQIIAAFNDRRGLRVGNRLETGELTFDPVVWIERVERLNSETGEAEILEEFFTAQSPFGPMLKREFVARSQTVAPVAAFRSLLLDLFERPPKPLIYSRLPIEKAGTGLMNLKSDLMLSHIELIQARGLKTYEFASLSEAAETYYQTRDRAKRFQDKYSILKRGLVEKIKKLEARKRGLESDLAKHDDPEKLKKYGDLLLANQFTARVSTGTASVIDYYDPTQPLIEIEIDEGVALPQAANEYFARYQKGKRAIEAIAPRLSSLVESLDSLNSLLIGLEKEPTAERVESVKTEAARRFGLRMAGEKEEPDAKGQKANISREAGRWFISSDGFQIGVGRNDRENDRLTFRSARPQDIWLHAADYPGSHVVIRNPNRQEVPHKTVLEAAEIAAFYSQAKREAKAAVHYTQKKFVSKPPKAKPGLVRLSSFKTIMVQPGCNAERLE